jgi:hypothetical protein
MRGLGRAVGAPLNARGAQENLWPKSFLGRPVARHFVYFSISTWRAVCKLVKTQVSRLEGFVGIALRRARFTSAREPSNEGAEWLWKGAKRELPRHRRNAYGSSQ